MHSERTLRETPLGGWYQARQRSEWIVRRGWSPHDQRKRWMTGHPRRLWAVLLLRVYAAEPDSWRTFVHF